MATLALRNPLGTSELTKDQFASKWQYPMVSPAVLEETEEHEFTFSAPASTYRVVVRNRALSDVALPVWIEPTIAAFIEIQKLSENWDSYGGKPINQDLIKQSLSVLAQVMRANFPAPAVVPLGDGGIQIEWHRRQQDFEIAFLVDEAAQFYYRNRNTGESYEGDVDNTERLITLLGNLA